jgi:hypothetical protein
MTRKLAACLVLGLAVAPPALAASYYYEATTTESGGKSDAPVLTRMRAWVDGPRAKVEVIEGPKSGLPVGSYLVTRDGGESVFFVNPKKAAYAKWELDATLRDVADRLNGEGLVKLELSDVTDQPLLDEPGEPLLGQATIHKRWKSGYTIKYGALGMTRQRRDETVKDVWVTDAITVAGFDALLSPRQVQTGNALLDKALIAKLGNVKGFTLKSASVTTTKDDKGREETRRSSTVVIQLREEASPAARFEIPATYTERPFKKVR